MTELALSPALVRTLGSVLLHFMWQGAALGAVYWALLSLCRRPTTRYAFGVATLAMMTAAPAVTLWWLAPAGSGAARSSIRPPVQIEMREAATPMAAPGAPERSPDPVPSPAYVWLVGLWFAGVVFFSLRAVGGFLWLEHVRSRDAEPVESAIKDVCLGLQRQLGLERVVRYCQSNRLDAPAVIGWFRPVVMLPMTTLTGLDSRQLEAVIAHELAHIRRFDCFVNLFQVAAEALLFYHPAVWWVNRQIRADRENCCDDIAVSISGGARDYVRALMALEERRGSMTLALAANGSPLAKRIARLLGLPRPGREFPGVALAAGLMGIAGALVAGTALLGFTHAPSPLSASASVRLASEPTNLHSLALASPSVEAAADSLHNAVSTGLAWARANNPGATSPSKEYVGRRESQASEAPATAKTEEPSPADQTGKESFIEGMKAAGFDNLSADQLIALKVQGVTPAYIRELRAAGFKLNVDELIGMKVQGVTPEYVRDVQAAGFKPTADQIIGLKVQGVTPDYIREMRALGFTITSLDEVIGMKVQGVTPEYVRALNAEGLHPNGDEIVAMKVQGVTPEYVRGLKAQGITASVDELVGMKVQGITPEYIRDLKGLGISGKADGLIGMKVQGVTPEYVRDIRATGLNPSVDELVGMKVQGVTPGYIHGLQSAGLKGLRVDDYISAKVMGVTPDFVEKARSHGFKDLSLDKLIALKQADVF